MVRAEAPEWQGKSPINVGSAEGVTQRACTENAPCILQGGSGQDGIVVVCRARRWRWLLAMMLAPAAACSFHSGYGTGYQCGVGDTCPTGQTCVAGYCQLAAPPDGGPDGGGGGPDAGTPTARCGTLALLRDDFEAASIDSIWYPWHDTGVTVTQTGGYASIQLPAGTADNWGGLGSFFYDLTDSEVQTTVSQVGGVDTVLEVRNPDDYKLQMVVENGQLNAGVYNIPGGGTRASVTYDPQVHSHWRIREQAGTVHWEWSTDGATWTELWSEADPFSPIHAQVQLAAGGLLADVSEARFDEVNTLVPTPAAGFCTIDDLVDGFDHGSLAPVWSWWNDSPSTIAEAGSQVVMTFPTSSKASVWAGFDANHLFDVSDGAVYVDVTDAPQVALFVTYFDLYARGNTKNRLEFNLEGDQLQLVQFVANSAVSQLATTYDPAKHRYWRVRGGGGKVYFDVSADAQSWNTLLEATAQVDLGAMAVEVGAGYYSNGPGVAETVTLGGVSTP